MSKREARAQDVRPEQAGLARALDGTRHASLGFRVLAADVEVAERGTGRVGGDRHRLDDRERVLLEEDAILERAGLGLVGVADQVVGLGLLGRHGRPLPTRREGRSAASDEVRRGDLGDDGVGADLDRLGEGRGSRRAPGSHRGRRGRPCPVGQEDGDRVVVTPRPAAGSVRRLWANRAALASGEVPPGSASRPRTPMSREQRQVHRMIRPPRGRGPGRRPWSSSPSARHTARGTGCGTTSLVPRGSACPADRCPPRPPGRDARHRRGGTRCRRRRGPRPAAGAWSHRAHRTSRPRRPRRAARQAASRCS